MEWYECQKYNDMQSKVICKLRSISKMICIWSTRYADSALDLQEVLTQQIALYLQGVLTLQINWRLDLQVVLSQGGAKVKPETYVYTN